MARVAKALAAWEAEDIRPVKYGDLWAYDAQHCPTCGEWRPRFHGDAMYDGSRSLFTQCARCRNGWKGTL